MTAHGIQIDRKWRAIALTPAAAIFVAMSLLPVLNLMAMSVHEIKWVAGHSVWSYVGFTHYRRLAEDELLQAGIGNTAIFAVVGVTIQVVLGFFLAWAVSRIRSGRTLYRTIFILPILVPGILIGAVWKLMLNFDFGLVNGAIGLLGLHPVDWLGPALGRCRRSFWSISGTGHRFASCFFWRASNRCRKTCRKPRASSGRVPGPSCVMC